MKDRNAKGQFVKGNSAGRQFESGNQAASKYKDEYCDRMLKYFRDEDVKYPQFEEFADSINVDTATLNNWCERHRRFRDIRARCVQIQRAKLNKYALLGVFSASYAKFIAVNHHGMTEKTVNDSNVTFNVQYSDEETQTSVDEESN